MAVKIIPVSELRQNLKRILATLEDSGEPYFITQSGRLKAVLARYEDQTVSVARPEERYPHITRQPGISGGEPIIRGTRISVRHIMERVQAGQSVSDILAALPHVTPAQVHAALSYYFDHQAEIDRLIAESRPEQVIARHGLRLKELEKGIAIVEPAE